MEKSNLVLPSQRELPLGFQGFLENLDKQFSTRDTFSSLSSTASELNSQCEEFDTTLLNLQRYLGKLIVSWICRSVGAKTALRKLSLNFPNQYVDNKMLGNDFLSLIKELRRIDNIRRYCEAALQLEALIGDFEDAVFSVLNHRIGDIVSMESSLFSSDLGPKHNLLIQATKSMSHAEDLLVTIAKIYPHWIHMVKSVDARVDKALAIIQPKVLADHRALLASVGWPPKFLISKVENGTFLDHLNPLVLMQVNKGKSYSDSFLVLCALQQFQYRREERRYNLSGHKREGNGGLWAIDELVSPIASRTQYHCSKWVNQPELMFALVYRITRDFVSGVEDVLQPLIDRAGLVSCSAKEAWVSTMVQMLSGFLARMFFSVLADRYKEKQSKAEVLFLWIHLIDLMLVFDRQMQSLLSTENSLIFAGSESHGLLLRAISLLSIFCDRPDWTKIWAKIELKTALKKLKAELIDDQAWSNDKQHGIGFSIYEEAEEFLLCSRDDLKAPVVAEYVLKIALEMIERCQNLPAISLRIQYIRSTSVRLLWYFFNVMVVQCRNTELHVGNLLADSLKRPCIMINAARYCECKLLEWSDNVNFLGMRIAENGLYIHLEDDVNDNNSFFGEEIKCLVELETTWLIDLISALLRQFETLSKHYVRSYGCFEQKVEDIRTTTVSESLDFNVSVDFVEALDAIRCQLHIIKMDLNLKDFNDLWRSVADGIDHFIFCSILMSETSFSDDGISQFDADMQVLFCVFQPFCHRPEAFFPCLGDSLKLLKIEEEEVKHLLALSDDETRRYCLQSHGISHISFEQAAKISKNRKS